MNQSNDRTNETGLALGLGIIGVIAGLLGLCFWLGLASGPVGKGAATTVLGVYVMFWGLLFLASYYYCGKCFFFRGLMWICEHFSRPRGARWMAMFYFGMTFLGGGWLFLVGLGVIPGP
jgi:hypothetical protein